ncbi:MAG: decaprenylphospho-beta-D-erythro-pentofuranosid-2-ulose 2-reductase [Ilumatobacter sp.]|nr:MAG: decaprenylphospho-beta-D-erythro-pentofuranosid-2-ulose 2-reductase [Ilumatobacter sp.]
MQNALGEIQTIAVFGGTSEIGLAIARRLITPSTRTVVLACRDVDAGARAAADLGRDAGTDPVMEAVTIEVVAFDAADTDSHLQVVAEIADTVGDLDVVVLAFGVLGDQAEFDADPAAAVGAVHVNYTGAVSVGLVVADVLRRQGHGRLVVLSSVAGERVRKANFVYGSSKAGLDGFAQGLGDSLEGSGASVLVVRPGFVHSRMTEGLAAAPFATDPDSVAEVVARGLRQGRRTVWAPGVLRYVFMVLRHLPGAVYRRLPLG